MDVKKLTMVFTSQLAHKRRYKNSYGYIHIENEMVPIRMHMLPERMNRGIDMQHTNAYFWYLVFVRAFSHGVDVLFCFIFPNRVVSGDF